MKQVVVILCLFFVIFLSGCNTLNKKFDEIEEKIKSNIPELIYENIQYFNKNT